MLGHKNNCGPGTHMPAYVAAILSPGSPNVGVDRKASRRVRVTPEGQSNLHANPN